MKKYSFILAIASITLLASCLKNHYEATVPTAPAGTFSGQFKLLHRTVNSTVIDTPKKATIQLQMNTNGYTYNIIGDTSIHAGSHGTYQYDGTFIQFNDVTYPTVTIVMPKPHLTGIYQYLYDGAQFQAVRTYADTLSYQYSLRKTQ